MVLLRERRRRRRGREIWWWWWWWVIALGGFCLCVVLWLFLQECVLLK
jgi:hypothetical protein